jgi:hypothetical protein
VTRGDELKEQLDRCDLELARVAETPGTWPEQTTQLKNERERLLAEIENASTR